jgi:phosphopantothenoylcysteine decarboxylase/phosphopantothenate--cysteine ligase
VDTIAVETALELRAETLSAAKDSDVVIMAAAVADFRPADPSGSKIKKRDDADDPVIRLIRNPDILAELVQARPESAPAGQLIVGFAAETGDERGGVLEYARAKLERKGCDLLVVNQVGAGKVFGQDHNDVLILNRDGGTPIPAAGTKDEVARAVVEQVAAHLALG